MSCVIQILGWAIHKPCDIADEYIKWVDVQFYHRPKDLDQPVREMVKHWLITTPDINQAYRFKDSAVALKVYREILRSDPVRPAGKPNRPLTAFHINLFVPPLPEGSVIKEGKQ
jgi:hypothetical protein